MENLEYTKLLEKFNGFKIERKKQLDSGEHDYSLINSLLKANREVQLHSNFIYSMINPEGLHYCGNMFLRFFLESIGLLSKIDFDLSTAKVFKERDNIDLFITDGEKFIIIENKLDALDQPFQITRYISKIIENYNLNTSEGVLPGLSKKIVVVYLSKHKKYPSKSSESIIGFDISGKAEKVMKWQNEPVDNKQGRISVKLNLKDNTEFKYMYMEYFTHLRCWIKESKSWLLSNSPKKGSLVYAFSEYEQIIDRLDKSKSWRNVLNFENYIANLESSEKKEMYEFMTQATESLPNFVGETLFKEIPEKLGVLANELNIVPGFKEFTESNCKNWVKKKGSKKKWKDLAFSFKRNSGEYIFCLAENYIYLAKYNSSDWDFKPSDRLKISNDSYFSRSTILENKIDSLGLFKCLDAIEKWSIETYEL